jgi:hypothetical protein
MIRLDWIGFLRDTKLKEKNRGQPYVSMVTPHSSHYLHSQIWNHRRGQRCYQLKISALHTQLITMQIIVLIGSNMDHATQLIS